MFKNLYKDTKKNGHFAISVSVIDYDKFFFFNYFLLCLRYPQLVARLYPFFLFAFCAGLLQCPI